MKEFLDENFLLNTRTSRDLYHQFASGMPIIDYHNHLPPEQIARDINFNNLTQVWLNGDHYKWRAMRANGIDEQYITGGKSDYEKFEKWAETVPYTLRNPLYHWTHLELRRYFGVYDILDGASARKVFEECSAKLQTKEYSVRGLLKMRKVEMVGTTDDPTDSLEWHRLVAEENSSLTMLPTFRPDKAMAAEDVPALNQYINRLEEVSDIAISDFEAFLSALKKRHDFFAEHGCRASDHGLEQIYSENYTEAELKAVFMKIREGKALSGEEILKFKSGMLHYFALWNHEKGWVQQFHLGALRNNNTRLLKKLGPDTGFDSIGDFSQARQLSRFLNRLDADDKLTKTILYNLNPADNELFAAMIGNFNDGSVAGKVQFGSGWWFLDQKDGMIRQLNALSNMGLLSRFIGMLTDSRSFLSYPRHEYFRRILCDLFGQDVENGELPADLDWLGKVVKDICYYNAKDYFGLS